MITLVKADLDHGHTRSVWVATMAWPNDSRRFCNPGMGHPQADVVQLVEHTKKHILSEKWRQHVADWDCCPFEHTLKKWMHPAVGQVPAPEMLRQDLQAECTQLKLGKESLCMMRD